MGEWYSRPVSRIMKEPDSSPGGLSGRVFIKCLREHLEELP